MLKSPDTQSERFGLLHVHTVFAHDVHHFRRQVRQLQPLAHGDHGLPEPRRYALGCHAVFRKLAIGEDFINDVHGLTLYVFGQ